MFLSNPPDFRKAHKDFLEKFNQLKEHCGGKMSIPLQFSTFWKAVSTTVIIIADYTVALIYAYNSAAKKFYGAFCSRIAGF